MVQPAQYYTLNPVTYSDGEVGYSILGLISPLLEIVLVAMVIIPMVKGIAKSISEL
jgi:hypothetical protein